MGVVAHTSPGRMRFLIGRCNCCSPTFRTFIGGCRCLETSRLNLCISFRPPCSSSLPVQCALLALSCYSLVFSSGMKAWLGSGGNIKKTLNCPPLAHRVLWINRCYDLTGIPQLSISSDTYSFSLRRHV